MNLHSAQSRLLQHLGTCIYYPITRSLNQVKKIAKTKGREGWRKCSNAKSALPCMQMCKQEISNKGKMCCMKKKNTAQGY